MLTYLPSFAAHEIDGARHELLQESPTITARVWDLIDPFLERGRSRESFVNGLQNSDDSGVRPFTKW